jgi:hypothetical protein
VGFCNTTVVVFLNTCGKCPRFSYVWISVRRCCWIVGNVLFNTAFVISLGPGAFLGDSLLIALSSCCIVMVPVDWLVGYSETNNLVSY